MSQSDRRRQQRRYERQCKKRGHTLIPTSLGMARCSNCGLTMSLLGGKR